MVLINGVLIDLPVLITIILIAGSLFYTGLLIVLSRRKSRVWEPRDWDAFTGVPRTVIFLMPCLNEETVIARSLERLLTDNPVGDRRPSVHVVVIDDGSDDGTADVVRSFDDSRLHLHQRVLPNARKGKGEALNDAFSRIVAGEFVSDLDPEQTIIAVVDADGRLDPETLDYVLPSFDDPKLAGTQIGVRINNRTSNLLARMQDMEFVIYTEVYQRGRSQLGSVGLGGNGQFVRLSALQGLGDKPWSKSLTEDLDLGIRLQLLGYDLAFCPKVAVHQQGLVSLKRWLRQRARWFQGFLQAWSQIWDVLTRLSGTRRVDLLVLLMLPAMLLIGAFFTLSMALWLLTYTVGLFAGAELTFPWFLILAYVLAVGPSLVLTLIYRTMEPGLGPLTTLLFGHTYVGYSLLWILAGWRALWNQLRGQTGWAKTDREAENEEEATAAGENT